MKYKGTFKCTIMTPDALVYENDIFSIFISGDRGEYELLAYHFPVIGYIPAGNVIINWKETVALKMGIIKFFANDCIILIEQKERPKKKFEKKDDDIVIAEEHD